MWFWLLSCPYVATWNPSPAISASVCWLLPPSSCRGWPGKNVVSRLKPVVPPSEPMPPNPHYAHTCRSLLSLGSRFTRCGSSNGLTRSRPWPSRLLFSMRLGRHSAENLVAVTDIQVFIVLAMIQIRPSLPTRRRRHQSVRAVICHQQPV